MNEQFLLQMQQILKDEYPAYLESLSNPPTRGFRINPLKTNEKDFFEKVDVSHTKSPYAKYGYYTDLCQNMLLVLFTCRKQVHQVL